MFLLQDKACREERVLRRGSSEESPGFLPEGRKEREGASRKEQKKVRLSGPAAGRRSFLPFRWPWSGIAPAGGAVTACSVENLPQAARGAKGDRFSRGCRGPSAVRHQSGDRETMPVFWADRYGAVSRGGEHDWIRPREPDPRKNAWRIRCRARGGKGAEGDEQGEERRVNETRRSGRKSGALPAPPHSYFNHQKEENVFGFEMPSRVG